MYQNMNDYEILYMVSEDSDSFEVLCQKYRPLIYKMVKEYQNTFKKYGYELDDLMQLGFIALYKSARLYNIYNQSMFFSYLKSAIYNIIVSELRKNTTSKKEMLNSALSYDAVLANTNCSILDFIGAKDNNWMDLNFKIMTFKNTLDFNLACVFELFYHGYKLNEIAILLDETIEIVKNDFKEIRKKALTYKCLFFN